ncbi:class I SAM-dependent methyltransferase [Streptomyces sp. NPDC055189]
MTAGEYRDPRTVPHESDRERESRERLAGLLAETPIPVEYLIDNLPVYLRRNQLADLLAIDALYKMVADVPGTIMEFGVLHGRHLASFTALRGIYEPYDSIRRIIGFDTFQGFPDIAEIDRATPSAEVGRFAVPDGEIAHLREVLTAHELSEPLGHMQRSFVVPGDVRKTVPQYLEENPETVVALAYFDLDIYEPTREILDVIRPHLVEGSILAFDEIAHPKWPGETRALSEFCGLGNVRLRKLPHRESPITYLEWRGN